MGPEGKGWGEDMREGSRNGIGEEQGREGKGKGRKGREHKEAFR